MANENSGIEEIVGPGKTLRFPEWLGKEVSCSVCGAKLVLNAKHKVGKCGDHHYVACETCRADIHFSS